MRPITRVLVGGLGLAVSSYATYPVVAWARYGRPRRSSSGEYSTLDQFMATYEVVERHQVRVGAPSPITFSAACEMDLEDWWPRPRRSAGVCSPKNPAGK